MSENNDEDSTSVPTELSVAGAEFVEALASAPSPATELAFQDEILPPTEANEMVRDLDKVLTHMSQAREYRARTLTDESQNSASQCGSNFGDTVFEEVRR
jgi:hypothetical protein